MGIQVESGETKMDAPVTLRWRQGDIALLRKSGQTKSLSEISKILGRSRQSVESKAQELGIRYQKKGELHHNTTHSDEKVTEAMILYFMGCSQQEIANKTRVPFGTVSNWTQGLCRNDNINWDTVEREVRERLQRQATKEHQ